MNAIKPPPFSGRIRRFDRPGKQESYPDEVAAQTEKSVPKVAQKPALPKRKRAVKQEVDKKAIDNGATTPYIDLNDILSGLSTDEQSIVFAIGTENRLVDDVIAQTGLPAGKVLATLTLLEVKGVVKRLPGRQVAISKNGAHS